MQLRWLELMPGDLHDPRLNAYFLEHIFQFVAGNAESLWHLDMFYPFPYVGGMSDNLWGASPLYLLPRAFGSSVELSFQIWFLCSYAANYLAAYLGLRHLGLRPAGSIFGALVFAFGLPATAHFNTAQVAYRFAGGLAVVAAASFVRSRRPLALGWAGVWLTWQYYCSIYLGIFASLAVMVIVVAGVLMVRPSTPGVDDDARALDLGSGAHAAPLIGKGWAPVVAILAGCAIALGLLMFPYVRVVQIYDAGRSFDGMIEETPSALSYLSASHSSIWREALVTDGGEREETQVFFGLMPLLGLCLGAFVVARRRQPWLVAMLVSLVVITILTSRVGVHSPWRLMTEIPPFSAIRFPGRVVQISLMMVAAIGGVGLDWAVERSRALEGFWLRAARYLSLVVVLLLVVELSSVVPSTSSKRDWVDRVQQTRSLLPAEPNEATILAFATPDGPCLPADELDGMWVAMQSSSYTINGFSGFATPGYNIPAGSDPSQVIERIGWYLVYAGEASNTDAYVSIARRIMLVGFDSRYSSDQSWLIRPRTLTLADRLYSDEELKGVAVTVVDKDESRGVGTVDVDITNVGETTICAASYLEKPVQVAWRFVYLDGSVRRWQYRALPCDLAPGESVPMRIIVGIQPVTQDCQVEFAIVQKGAGQPIICRGTESKTAWLNR